MSKKKQYTFIDLFAGLGGFNYALSRLGCKCVFASELKEDLRKLYEINFPGIKIVGDITLVKPEDIPSHDILCAGFPCQPFSQAGERLGFDDEKGRGNLFYYIRDIAKYHKPQYIFLENVSNLKGHDKGKTWVTIKSELENIGYYVPEPEILSPHQFGIPQHRKRIYIVCELKEFGCLNHFKFPSVTNAPCDIHQIIDESEAVYMPLKKDTRQQLSVWQEFIDQTIAHGDSIPSFPIWAMEFGADYDFESVAPAFQTVSQLNHKKGKLGDVVIGSTVEDCLRQLPVYAQTSKSKVFPKWKITYIQQNRAFYEKHKKWLDDWIKKISTFENSHQKMEWNCGKNATPSIEDKIVQFRASGIRIKLPTYSPALNLIGTQVPIFPWVELPQNNVNKNPQKGRYMSCKEAAKLQGMEKLCFGNEEFHLTSTRIYEALGNAVNTQLIEMIANNFLNLK